MDFSWRSLQECFRMLHSLVRQSIHVWCQSMRLLEEFLALPVFVMKHTTYGLCLPSERGLGMDVDLADPVSSRKFSGFSCPWLQLRSSLWCRSQSLFGSTIAATATVVIFCGGVCVAMSCGGGFFHSWRCLRCCLGHCEADDWKLHFQLFSVPRVRWLCLHAEWLVQQH